jgi:hypothetical protein
MSGMSGLAHMSETTAALHALVGRADAQVVVDTAHLQQCQRELALAQTRLGESRSHLVNLQSSLFKAVKRDERGERGERGALQHTASQVRQMIEGAWCAGYYHDGYKNDGAYASAQAEATADKFLGGDVPEAGFGKSAKGAGLAP